MENEDNGELPKEIVALVEMIEGDNEEEEDEEWEKTPWDYVGRHLSVDDMVEIVDDIDDSCADEEGGLTGEEKILALRECFKLDFASVLIDNDPSVFMKLYNLLFHLLPEMEFKVVKANFAKILDQFQLIAIQKHDPDQESKLKEKARKIALLKLEEFWRNVLHGVYNIHDIHQNIQRNYEIEFEFAIEGEPTAKSEVNFVIRNTGIYKQKITHKKGDDGSISPVVTETQAWKWDSFSLLAILRDKNEYNTVYTYNFVFNGDFYQNRSLKQIKELLEPRCCMYSKYKQLLGPLVLMLQNAGKIPVIDFSSVWGFSRQGWRMPDRFYIKFTPGQEKMRKCAEDMVRMKIDEEQARVWMQELYAATSIYHKDPVFAWMMVMPFLYALRTHTNLMPWLGLGSISGDTGKTIAGVMVTTKIWSNLNRQFVTKDQISSEARLGLYMTSGTFGIVIDDCSDLPIRVLNTLKTYTTGDAGFTRMNTSHETAIDRDFTAPYILTYNKTPDIMNDMAFLSRGIHIPVQTKPSRDEVVRFNAIWRRIPPGYIGRYIYHVLKDLSPDELIQLYESMPEDRLLDDARQRTMYKLFRLGAYFFEKCFSIVLDLSRVTRLIRDTAQMGADDVFAIVGIQILDGNLDRHQDEDGNFKPGRRWIQAPVLRKKTKKYDGWLYTTDTLMDLNARLKMTLSLPELAEILQRRWKTVLLLKAMKHADFPGGAQRCVFIPQSVVDEDKSARELEIKEERVMLCLDSQQQELNDNPVPLDSIVQAMSFYKISEELVIDTLERAVENGEIRRLVQDTHKLHPRVFYKRVRNPDDF